MNEPTQPAPPEMPPYARVVNGNYLPCDYPEDARHENGSYVNKCRCGTEFIGHKRRMFCRVCAEQPAPPQPEPPTDTERAHAFEWLRKLGLEGTTQEARFAYVAMQTMLRAAPPEPQRCEPCDGSGVISYNPNLNPNEFAGIASAQCTHCGGTGTTKGETEAQQSAVEWVKKRLGGYSDLNLPKEEALELAERCDAAEQPGWRQSCMSIALKIAPLTKSEGVVDAVQEVVDQLATVQAERDEMRRRWHKSRRACRQQGRGMAMHARVMQLQAAETLLMRQQRDEAFDERRAAQAEAGRFRAELENFINANPRKWEDQADQFEQWVKSRSRAALKEGQP